MRSPKLIDRVMTKMGGIIQKPIMNASMSILWNTHKEEILLFCTKQRLTKHLKGKTGEEKHQRGSGKIFYYGRTIC